MQEGKTVDKKTKTIKGMFYTPNHLVQKALAYLEDVLGKDFYQKYTVWDPASGTGNLTKTKTWAKLYSSTLFEFEHKAKIDNNVNPEATHFVYDFLQTLNDWDLWEKYPKLAKALEEDYFLFYLNPPYFCGGKAFNGCFGAKIKNPVSEIRNKQGVKGREFESDFLFKIIQLLKRNKKKAYIGIFVPVSLFFRKAKGYSIAQYILDNCRLVKGFCCDACEFPDLAAYWKVGFFIFEVGKESKNKTELTLDYKDEKLTFVLDQSKLVDFRQYSDNKVLSIGYKNKHGFTCVKIPTDFIVYTIFNTIIINDFSFNYPNAYENNISFKNKLGFIAAVLNSGISLGYYGGKYIGGQIKKPIDNPDDIKKLYRYCYFLFPFLSRGITTVLGVYSFRNLKVDDPQVVNVPTRTGFRGFIHKVGKNIFNIYNHFWPLTKQETIDLYNKHNRPDLIDDFLLIEKWDKTGNFGLRLSEDMWANNSDEFIEKFRLEFLQKYDDFFSLYPNEITVSDPGLLQLNFIDKDYWIDFANKVRVVVGEKVIRLAEKLKMLS